MKNYLLFVIKPLFRGWILTAIWLLLLFGAIMSRNYDASPNIEVAEMSGIFAKYQLSGGRSGNPFGIKSEGKIAWFQCNVGGFGSLDCMPLPKQKEYDGRVATVRYFKLNDRNVCLSLRVDGREIVSEDILRPRYDRNRRLDGDILPIILGLVAFTYFLVMSVMFFRSQEAKQ